MVSSLSLSSTVMTIGKIFVLMFLGYALFRFKLIDKSCTDKMSLLLVRVFFPALIVSKTINHFSFTEYEYWWFLPLCAILFILMGAVIALLIYGLTGGEFISKKEFIGVCSFQNCGYLPMNLILFAFAGVLRDRLLIYMFLFIVGFNVFMWSLFPLFLQGKLKKDISFKVFLNSPVLATVFSLLWVAIMGRGTLPDLIAGPAEQLANAAFPMAMITLGSYLACYRAYSPSPKMPIFLTATAKLVLLPLVVLLILIKVPVPEDYRFFLFLQSFMPTAVSLVVIGGYTDSDNRFISSVIFYTHLFAFFTIPMWIFLYGKLDF